MRNFLLILGSVDSGGEEEARLRKLYSPVPSFRVHEARLTTMLRSIFILIGCEVNLLNLQRLG
jgi:hypothetical protein